jgi:hypothetical protein
MKNLLTLTALLLPALGLAHESGSNGIPDCRNIDGKLVQVANASEDYLRLQAYTKIALSTTANDEIPLILLDVTTLTKLPEPFQHFVFFHECGHHQLGHVTPESIRRQMVLRQADLDREIEADCKSVQRLVNDPQFNFGQKEIDVIKNELMVQLGASSVQKDPQGKVIKKGEFKFYMAVEKRNGLLQQCYEKAALEKSLKQ